MVVSSAHLLNTCYTETDCSSPHSSSTQACPVPLCASRTRVFAAASAVGRIHAARLGRLNSAV